MRCVCACACYGPPTHCEQPFMSLNNSVAATWMGTSSQFDVTQCILLLWLTFIPHTHATPQTKLLRVLVSITYQVFSKLIISFAATYNGLICNTRVQFWVSDPTLFWISPAIFSCWQFCRGRKQKKPCLFELLLTNSSNYSIGNQQ